MKTEISDLRVRPDKRYSGVYLQQARPLTDADWNEQTDLVKQRLYDVLRDLVGSGAPRLGRLEFDADTKRIKPGRLYVDGIVAELPGQGTLEFDQQPDFPDSGPLPSTGTAYVVYADVWERTVVSLEDDLLRDPGLHGADTCTRTQTMLQVKWCPPGANLDTLPPQGNAFLRLELRDEAAEQADACDPCAQEVQIEQRIGNYLFRVEVHDVETNADDDTVSFVLKWSSENGAEQHPAAEIPDEFQVGDYVYEFYNDSTEKHLGLHYSSPFAPQRGQIVSEFAAPPSGFDCVRRWDGYCKLVRQANDEWQLVEGSDLGGLVVPGAVPGNHLELVLKAFQFRIENFRPSKFVAGDYWLAVVRENAETEPDQRVRQLSLQPQGIRHHYLRLASIQADGTALPLTPEELRQLNFPPLTDLEATDIEYDHGDTSDSWQKLFDLIALGDSQLPAEVQDAIDKLVARVAILAGMANGQQGWMTVGENGQFATLAEAFETLRNADAISLWLLAGRHAIAGDLVVTGPKSIRLNGPGCEASEVILQGRFDLRCNDVELSHISFDATSKDHGLVLAADRVTAHGCSFFHTLDGELHPWSGASQLAQQAHVVDVALGLRNDVLVGGVFQGTIRFGRLRPPPESDERAAFVARFNRHSGTPRRLFASTGDGEAILEALSTDAEDNALLSGWFAGEVSFGDAPTTSQSGVFVVKLGRDLQHEWSRYFASGRRPDFLKLSIAPDPANDVLVAGSYTRVMVFDDQHTLRSGGLSEGFVVKMKGEDHESDQVLWAHNFATGVEAGWAFASSVGADSQGNVYVAGELLVRHAPPMGHVAVQMRKGDNGNFVKQRLFAHRGRWSLPTLAVGPDGSCVLAGAFQGTLTVGPNDEFNAGTEWHFYVIKLRPDDLEVDWRIHGKVDGTLAQIDPHINVPNVSIALDPSGHVLLAGGLAGQLAFEEHDFVLTSQGEQDAFSIKLDGETGTPLWSQVFRSSRGTPESAGAVATAVAATSEDAAVIAGRFRQYLDFGTGPVMSHGEGEQVFVAKMPASEMAPLVHVASRTRLSRVTLDWSANEMSTKWKGRAGGNRSVVLALDQGRFEGVVRDTRFDGILLLNADLPEYLSVHADTILATVNLAKHVDGDGDLSLRSNFLYLLQTRIPAGAIVSGGLETQVKGFSYLTVTDNQFARRGSSLIADAVHLSGNRFYAPGHPSIPVAFILADKLTFVGNQSDHPTAVIEHLSKLLAEAANLVELKALPPT